MTPLSASRRAAALLTVTIALASGGLITLPGSAPAAPSCAEGPETVGQTIYGTPCDDTIRLPRAVTTVYGEGGDDTLYGQRGNDRLYGGPGNDRLYGGVGDDRLRGGPDDDLLSGGFGADSLDGEAGDDLARGDATIDWLDDTGGDEGDVLSFATGVTPGFPNAGSFFTDAGFSAGAEGRGVYVDMEAGFANNGLAPSGGGVDGPLEPATDFANFEVVIGTPFDDYIVGTTGEETLYGGGGADLIDGRGGGDVAHGGAGGDGCVEVAVSDCEFSGEEIARRDPGAIVAGVMAPEAGEVPPALYLTGSDGADDVTAAFAPGSVTFTLGPGSTAAFDTDPGETSGCQAPTGAELVCPLGTTPDSILLAGVEGADSLRTSGLPATVSLVLLGGENDDTLTGADTEDALVDGAGDDVVSGAGGDDALPNNGGADQLDAGPGEDLFISNAVCDGDSLDGGADRDNANWANFEPGVSIDMSRSIAGLVGSDGAPACPTIALLTTLTGIEDVEGTDAGDNLVGDAGPNQLLGRGGPDNYRAGAGSDLLLANSGDSDPLLDCGADFDTALIDIPTSVYADAEPIDCESVEERAVNSFRPPDTPPDPEPATTPEPPPPPPPDTTAPRTWLTHRPASLLTVRRGARRVAFAFRADEPARFRCRIDRRPYRDCASPFALRVGRGRHVFRVFAVDAAGNRDRSVARAVFRVHRIAFRKHSGHRR